jgi:23S rRNA (adenine2030-N6)-methyltransferase
VRAKYLCHLSVENPKVKVDKRANAQSPQCGYPSINYQHDFRAGNFADVFKHIVLSCIFVAPLRETNGFPLYRHSRRKRNLAPPAEFPLQRYPGSPAIAQALLRRHDRMFLFELHPRAFSKLKAILGARMKLQNEIQNRPLA